jgi:hypothetical protein
LSRVGVEQDLVAGCGNQLLDFSDLGNGLFFGDGGNIVLNLLSLLDYLVDLLEGFNLWVDKLKVSMFGHNFFDHDVQLGFVNLSLDDGN